MSDSAFKTHPYPSYTSDQLRAFIGEGRDTEGRMYGELLRRAKRDAGDVSVMSDGERLWHFKNI